MLPIVRQLDIARNYFSRAPSRGALSEAAHQNDVSRPTAYRIVEAVEEALGRGSTRTEIRRLRQNLQQAQQARDAAYETIQELRGQLEPDWRKIHRFIVQAAVAPASLRDTRLLVKLAFGVEVSHEYIRHVVNHASARAREVLQRLAPARKARRAVGDEIFLGADPLLVLAEPKSLAVLAVSVGPSRDKTTWDQLLDLLEAIELFASDLGKGITASVEAHGWPHQADLFHALRILLESVSWEERRSYEIIQREYDWERRLGKLRDAGEDTRGVATQSTLARQKTQRALERFDQIERLVRDLRGAVELCDPLGRWIPVADRERRIRQALDELERLGLARRRRVAGYWRNPKLLTFARDIEGRLNALQVSPGVLSRADLVEAAVRDWARRRGHLHGPRALVAALQVAAAGRSCPEFPALQGQVARIFDDALRASSGIETLNSLWRVYQQVKKTFATDFAYLVALAHNMHPFTEGPRRGRTPFELLGVDPGTRDWLDLVVE